jgi:hypothetical protein
MLCARPFGLPHFPVQQPQVRVEYRRGRVLFQGTMDRRRSPQTSYPSLPGSITSSSIKSHHSPEGSCYRLLYSGRLGIFGATYLPCLQFENAISAISCY